MLVENILLIALWTLGLQAEQVEMFLMLFTNRYRFVKREQFAQLTKIREHVKKICILSGRVDPPPLKKFFFLKIKEKV